jgi:hypothetical protein
VKTYVGLAAFGVTVTVVLGVTGWILVPTKPMAWIFVICFPPLLWAFLESAARGSTEAARAILRAHRIMIAALALVMSVDIVTDLAIYAGFSGGPEGEALGHRVNGLLRGTLFALWGNHLPKLMSPWSLDREPTPRRHWDYTQSIAMIEAIIGPDRMVPMTLEGLTRGMRVLT